MRKSTSRTRFSHHADATEDPGNLLPLTELRSFVYQPMRMLARRAEKLGTVGTGPDGVEYVK